MDIEKRNQYAEALLNAYQNEVLKIIWSTSGFSIAINQKKKELLPESKEEEFIEYTFAIAKMVIELAEGKHINKENEGDFKTALVIFENEFDLKNHLYIKKNSKLDCYKLLEWEIISHRNEDNPKDVEVTSAIIKMVIERDSDDISYSFEASRRDIEDMIAKLLELKEKMDLICQEG